MAETNVIKSFDLKRFLDEWLRSGLLRAQESKPVGNNINASSRKIGK